MAKWALELISGLSPLQSGHSADLWAGEEILLNDFGVNEIGPRVMLSWAGNMTFLQSYPWPLEPLKVDIWKLEQIRTGNASCYACAFQLQNRRLKSKTQ